MMNQMIAETNGFGTVVDAKGVEPATAAVVPSSIKIPYRLYSYNTDCQSMGRVYVFSHQTYDNNKVSERKGNKRDVDAIMKAMPLLGFDKPIVMPDFRQKDIEEQINNIAKADFSDYNAVVLIFLTHGTNGKLSARDKEYPVESIWKPFLESHPSLIGKPKIFIIQACRGVDVDPGIRKNSNVDAAGIPPPAELEDDDFKIPRFADMLIAYSTPSGYVSFREEKEGSWFIQSLCNCINQVKDKLSEHDFETILIMVKHYISYNLESGSLRAEYHEKKQIPFISSTLTKKLYMTNYQEMETDGGVGVLKAALPSLMLNGACIRFPGKPEEEVKQLAAPLHQHKRKPNVFVAPDADKATDITIELPNGIKIHVRQ